jgi:hypothetical protein
LAARIGASLIPTKQVGDAVANVGQTQAQATVSLQGMGGVRTLLGMLLHLTSRKLSVHADRHSYDEVAVFCPGDMMYSVPSLAQFSNPPRELDVLPARLARHSSLARAIDHSC